MEDKVIFVACLLYDGVRDWWCEVVESLELGAVESMTCYDFFHQIQERVRAKK